MKSSIRITSYSPLLLLGLESYLGQSTYKLSGSGELSRFDLNEKPDKSFILLMHLENQLSENLQRIKKLRNCQPLTKVVLLVDDNCQKHIKAYFKAGIKAYLLPSVDLSGLEAALQQVTTGKSYLDPAVSQQWIQIAINEPTYEKKLTRREEEVLDLIISEYTTKEIASKLYISACTAETHRINIIRKLGVRNTAGIVREAVRMGW